MGLRVGGLASGIDTNALIESLLAVERLPLDRAEQRRSVLELEQNLFRDLNKLVKDLRTAATAIDNASTGLTGPSIAEELLSYTAASSDESVIVATGSSGATPGTTSVEVFALPEAARHVTSSFVSDTDIIAAAGETLTIDAGGANPISITVAAGGANLVDLRAAINADPNNTGEVRAEIIDDGSGFRLILSGTQTGAPNAVSVSTTITNGAAPFFDVTLEQAAADAQLRVFGIDVTRPGSTIDDLIPGVTLELKGLSTGPVDVVVDVDETAIEEKFQALADAYNAIIDFVDDQTNVDLESNLAGPLSGDSTLRRIQTDLRSVITSTLSFANNPFMSPGQIGIELDRDGRITIDSAKLSSALAQDPTSVRELFAGDATPSGVPGLALALGRAIDRLTESDPNVPRAIGIFAARDNGYQQQIDGIDAQIERLESRLAKREELLVLQFSQLETLLSGLQAQGNALLSLQTNNNRN